MSQQRGTYSVYGRWIFLGLSITSLVSLAVFAWKRNSGIPVVTENQSVQSEEVQYSTAAAKSGGVQSPAANVAPKTTRGAQDVHLEHRRAQIAQRFQFLGNDALAEKIYQALDQMAGEFEEVGVAASFSNTELAKQWVAHPEKGFEEAQEVFKRARLAPQSSGDGLQNAVITQMGAWKVREPLLGQVRGFLVDASKDHVVSADAYEGDPSKLPIEDIKRMMVSVHALRTALKMTSDLTTKKRIAESVLSAFPAGAQLELLKATAESNRGIASK